MPERVPASGPRSAAPVAGWIPIGRGTLARLAISGTVAALLLIACAAEDGGRVYDAPEAVEPLAPGRRVPSAWVATVRGERIDLAEQVRDHGALLVFYRGGW